MGLLSLIALAGAPAEAQPRCAPEPTRLSTDPFTNSTSQHRTEVEPDTFAFGSTIVAAFQAGRFFDGGASDIGWATSRDAGATWLSGFLPGITKFLGGGLYDRVSDPSVAYDARHGVWLIASLPLLEAGTVHAPAVVVSRSLDGLHWTGPVLVAAGGDLDKDWIVCDTAAGSPFYGHCYTEYDEVSAGERLHMATSRDGGLTWSEAAVPETGGVGGQPVVQPDGTVIVPLVDASGARVEAVTSTDGGLTYRGPVAIAGIVAHRVAGNLRAPPLPSADVDGAGRVYVVWHDCRFRAGCASNDIVFSTSSDGIAWSEVSRIPIDPTSSTVDHFVPGLAADRATAGGSAHLALTYYYYPQAGCSTSTCQLDVGFVSSNDGGASWSPPAQLAGPMSPGWLALTDQGAMVGDYISTSFAGGAAHAVFAAANVPTGSILDEAMYTSRCTVPVDRCGDVNGDGAVDVGDALLVAQLTVGLRRCGVAPFDHPELCDVNLDGTCNIGDALAMAQCDVGLVGCAFRCAPSTCP